MKRVSLALAAAAVFTALFALGLFASPGQGRPPCWAHHGDCPTTSTSTTTSTTTTVTSSTTTTSTTTTSTTPPPPSSYPPTAYSVHHFWLGLDGLSGFSLAADSPREDDLVAHTADSWLTQGLPFKTAQPNGHALFYADFGVAGDGVGTVLSESAARAAGYLAHHNGAEIPNPWGGTAKVVDVGAPGVCAAYVSALRAKYGGNPWDGVFADDVNAWYSLWNTGTAIDGYTSASDFWTRAMLPLVSCVAAQFPIVPNVGDWPNHADLDGAGLASAGALNEFFLTYNGAAVQTPAQAEREYASLRDLLAAGKVYLALVHRTDSQGLRFAFCAGAIMAGDRPDLFRVTNQTAYGSQPLAWDALLETPLGSPTTAVSHAVGSPLWSRSFTGRTLTIDTTAQTCSGL